ncbi:MULTISPECIES: hypothetical protein [Rothia]|uniref:hypothetical protein n=1 Tax=Rothia TaxID=32207 RepID=UPI0008D83E5E|nr:MULTISPECIES: hypothetical protein [Rothia]OFR96625.1 hypothetical protein HMPREF2756_01190 [Rothia sp. HMSC067H10]
MIPKEREDVEATLEQSTTPDPLQKEKRQGQFVCWLKSQPINKIVGSTLIIEALWVALFWFMPQVLHWWSWNPAVSADHFAQFYFAWGLGILSLGYIVLILWPIFKKDDDPRWFHARILSSGIVGGSYAFLLPVVMSLPEGSVNSGGAAALRQAILLATGGLIALIALGETRRKNNNDREAAENLREHQENMLIQQKEQFEANAFKDRKAERRERYTKAVEQLGDEKAPVRMGGVYTLVGLVDEWLEEESIRKYDRLKEGQVIINNLCAYIRSPFTLATRYDELNEDNPTSDGVYKDNQQKFYTDKAELKAEADVRLGIIKEIHYRLQGPGTDTPGTWSDFEYDFSESTFFYPVDLSDSYYFKSVNFGGSIYQNTADFSGSTYQNTASFGGSTYQRWANFSDSIYQGWISFGDSIYQGSTYFVGSVYRGLTSFGGSTYQDSVDFSDSTYRGSANFGGSTYKAETKFNDSLYESSVNFSNSTYYDQVDFHGYGLGSRHEGVIYRGTANFSHSIYLEPPVFGCSNYEKEVNFNDSIYNKSVDFGASTKYKSKADFSGSVYYGKASIGASSYESQVDFRNSIYIDEADFSYSRFHESYYFDGSVFCSSLELQGSAPDKENPRFIHDYPTYTNPRPENDKINRHITLFSSTGNNFDIALQGGQYTPNISNALEYYKFLYPLTSKHLEEYSKIINGINNARNDFKYIKNIQDKDKYITILKNINIELHLWRKNVTTVTLQNGNIISN